MKFKKLIASTVLAGVMALGVGVALNIKAETGKVDAAGNQEIFINTAGIGDWESGAETMAWISGGGQTNKWVMTTWIESNIRKFTLPANYTTVTLCRFSSSNHPADQSTDWWYDNWGQAWDFTPSNSMNYMSLTGWSDGKASYNTGFVKHFTSGQKVYVDIQGNESWWFEDYNTYFYTAVGNLKKWAQMSRIGSSNMLSATFSSDTYVDLAIIVRNNSDSFDGRTNQSEDILYTSDNASSNAFKLGSDSWGTTDVTGMESFSDAYIGDSFGYYFLAQGLCKDSGGLNTGYAALWSNTSSVYTSLSAYLSDSNYIKNSSSSGDSNLAKALARYDAVLSKNPSSGLSNYMSRSVFELGIKAVSPITSTSATAVVIAVTVISLTAIGGYIYLRRRKEN